MKSSVGNRSKTFEGLTKKFLGLSVVVIFMSIIEATFNALEIEETSAELTSADEIAGKSNSIK